MPELLWPLDLISNDQCKMLERVDVQIAQLTTIWGFRAHCYCASLVRTLFIRHARATSFSSARTESKTQQNVEQKTFAFVRLFLLDAR